MSALTEHYSLPLYERGDAAALISGYDVAMEIIDDLLWGFEQKLKDLDHRVTVLESRVDDLEQRVENLEKWKAEIVVWQGDVINKLESNDKAWQDLLNKIFRGGWIDEEGHLHFTVETGKIPIADINIFSGTNSPTNSTYTNALRSREAITDNDIKLS